MMMRRMTLAVGMFLVAGIAAGQDAPALKTDNERQSYALGMSQGSQFRRLGLEVDQDLYDRGFKDALSGGKTLLTDVELRAIMRSLQADLRKKQKASKAEQTSARKETAENKTTSGGASAATSGAGSNPEAGEGPKKPAPAPLAGINFSFKLDPRLAGGTYGGERWVSPPAFIGAAAQDTVDIRITGVGPKGEPVKISPKWTSSDPEMLTVSPEEGSAVTIKVKRAGQCSLKVAAGGVSRELTVKAEKKNEALQVSITPEPQKPTPKSDTAPAK